MVSFFFSKLMVCPRNTSPAGAHPGPSAPGDPITVNPRDLMLAPDATDPGPSKVPNPTIGHELPAAPRHEASGTAATATPAAARRRYACGVCTKTYSRPADLRRHMPEHDPDAVRYSCPFEYCNRKGSNGFLRADKLAEHRRALGH
jgi:hypothetical protein